MMGFYLRKCGSEAAETEGTPIRVSQAWQLFGADSSVGLSRALWGGSQHPWSPPLDICSSEHLPDTSQSRNISRHHLVALGAETVQAENRVPVNQPIPT